MDLFQRELPMWLVILIVFFAVLFLFWFKEKLQFFKLANKLPGPKGIFIFGNVLDFLVPHDRLIHVFSKICETFSEKPVIRLRLLHKVIVFILKTDAAEDFLINHKYLPKAEMYDLVKPWLGSGLLISSGAKWQKHRKLLTPSFHFRILENFLHAFNKHSETLVSILKPKADGSKFILYPYITFCTLDIICSTAMGKEINAQLDNESEYVKAVTKIGEIFILRSARPWLYPDWIFNLTSLGRKNKDCVKTLHSFTRQVISEKKESFLNGNYEISRSIDNPDEEIFGKKRRLAFLDTLLEMSCVSNVLTDEEIRMEVDTFMFEGHDTSSSSINFTLFSLGSRPEIQKRVHEELDSIFGEASDRQVKLEDLSQLKYLEAVIKETLRLFPPVAMFGKQTTKDINLAGYTIPAGVDVFIPLKCLHYDPENFSNPEIFDPLRFLSENSLTKRHPYGYIPFSTGPRNCIGQKFAMMEIKVVLSHILRNFQVTSYEKIEDIQVVLEPVLRPLKGFQMSLQRRW